MIKNICVIWLHIHRTLFFYWYPKFRSYFFISNVFSIWTIIKIIRSPEFSRCTLICLERCCISWERDMDISLRDAHPPGTLNILLHSCFMKKKYRALPLIIFEKLLGLSLTIWPFLVTLLISRKKVVIFCFLPVKR